MKKTVIISFIMLFTSGTAMAYDYADEMAYREIANINAQEQADVMHEIREGDFREAQQVMQYDEALKYQVQEQEEMYDRARYMNPYNNSNSYYSGW
jgi:hypothetical protein